MNFPMSEILGHKPSNCDCSMCQALALDGEKPLPKQPNYEEAVLIQESAKKQFRHDEALQTLGDD